LTGKTTGTELLLESISFSGQALLRQQKLALLTPAARRLNAKCHRKTELTQYKLLNLDAV
jgi:hypothetical protein